MPNIFPPTKNPVLRPSSPDALSITVSSVRRVIQGRTANQNFLGIPKKTPSYEELRAKERAMLKGLDEVGVPLEGKSDWRMNGPNKPEYTSPDQRIDRGLIIKDLVTLEEIKIQFTPQELNYSMESSFVPIASMARNNPLYHYTGSEDTLDFVLDWFAETENREDVIRNCKKLEALTKNDSFDKPPHHVKLIWNSVLFSDAVWVVVAAPYKLSMFQAHRNMLPQQAVQTITLKRVTENNPTIEQIRKITY